MRDLLIEGVGCRRPCRTPTPCRGTRAAHEVTSAPRAITPERVVLIGCRPGTARPESGRSRRCPPRRGTEPLIEGSRRAREGSIPFASSRCSSPPFERALGTALVRTRTRSAITSGCRMDGIAEVPRRNSSYTRVYETTPRRSLASRADLLGGLGTATSSICLSRSTAACSSDESPGAISVSGGCRPRTPLGPVVDRRREAESFATRCTWCSSSVRRLPHRREPRTLLGLAVASRPTAGPFAPLVITTREGDHSEASVVRSPASSAHPPGGRLSVVRSGSALVSATAPRTQRPKHRQTRSNCRRGPVRTRIRAHAPSRAGVAGARSPTFVFPRSGPTARMRLASARAVPPRARIGVACPVASSSGFMARATRLADSPAEARVQDAAGLRSGSSSGPGWLLEPGWSGERTTAILGEHGRFPSREDTTTATPRRRARGTRESPAEGGRRSPAHVTCPGSATSGLRRGADAPLRWPSTPRSLRGETHVLR